MSDPQHVLSLFDRTGNMVRPWARNGYICYAVDTQHNGIGVERVGEGAIIYIEADVREWKPPDVEYRIGFAFPPCTDLAVSGARWFENKGLRALADAIDLVGAGKEILETIDAPWMIENPVSTLSTHWRQPDYKFDPFEYTNYTDADNAYSKQTWLWTNERFQMPVKDGIEEDDADERIHTMPPVEDRSDKRASTPMGFAEAVYLSHTEPGVYAQDKSKTAQETLLSSI